MIPNKIYDVLKWIVMVALPATATLVSVILSLWSLAPAETITAIVGTISAVEAFLGALIGVSTVKYHEASK